ncbi:MAG: hypothetical protein VX498_15620 [Myxococcota bacterium]|nr:hypothetical protein [Myxococcota bacterium]
MSLRPSSFHRLASLIAALPLLASCGGSNGAASAYTITSADQLIGGPAADAWVGDFMLENQHLRAAILGDRCQPDDQLGVVCSTPGPGLFGGTLADIDLKRGNSSEGSGKGHDGFTELFGTINMDVSEAHKVEVVADGSDGRAAIVRVSGPAGNYISYIGLIRGILNLPSTYQYTDFILKPGARYITIRTTAQVVDPDLAPPAHPCTWEQGDEGLPCDEFLIPHKEQPQDLIGGLNEGAMQFGDFFLAGADVDIFLPYVGHDESRAVAESAAQGINNFIEPFSFPYLAAQGDQVSYAIATKGTIVAPLFTSSLTAVFGGEVYPEVDGEGQPVPFPVGTAYTYERFFGVGHGDIASALDSLLQAYVDEGIDIQLGEVRGHVVEGNSMQGISGARVLVYRDTGALPDVDGLPPTEDLYTEFESDSGNDSIKDGSFSGRLPVGAYKLVARDEKRGASPPVSIVVTEAGLDTGLIVPQSAALEVFIRDELGRALPSKISLRPLGTDTLSIRPQLGDDYFSGGFSHVVFAPYGEARIEVPTGRYEVFISRGIEYGLWHSEAEGWEGGIVVAPGMASRIEAVLPLEVDSTGFISADFHVHAHPSHDSGVPLSARVTTMVCEGVEFLSSTDHDYVTDYSPVIQSMGLDPWLQSTVGTETTTIEVGHYLGFPLHIDYNQPAGGAYFWTDRTPQQIVDGLRAKGAHSPEETAVFVGHPRDGIFGYFDQFGMDPFSGTEEPSASLLNAISNPTLANPENFTLDFDGLEILNGKRLDFVRTPTANEAACQRAFDGGSPLPECPNGTSIYDILARTMEEQLALKNLEGEFYLDADDQGQLDDWFFLLNLGYRHTALGNSDTHGITSIESGCPRNFVVSDVEEPEFIDERAIAQAVQEHRVVPSYGPLIRMEIDGAGIGSDVSSPTGSATLSLNIQAPRWMSVDRVELYENGTLIREFVGSEMSPGDVVKLDRQVQVQPTDEAGNPIDAWYVAVAMGNQDLSPMFTAVEVPKLEFSDVILGAVSSLDLGGLDVEGFLGPTPAFPKTHPVLPYGFTNPIWLDVNGDVDGNGLAFEALGRMPDWFRASPEE